MGRFATERRVHFQSSSSGTARMGPSCITPSKRIQRDVDVEAGAGTNADFLAQRGQERWRSHFEGVEAGQKAIGGVVSGAVGENGEDVRLAEPRICTTAPIWGSPVALRTYPEIAPGRSRPTREATFQIQPPKFRACAVSLHPTPWRKLQGVTLRQTSLTDQRSASRRCRSL